MVQFAEKRIDELFNVCLSDGDNKPNELPKGDMPLVSSGDTNQGIVGYFRAYTTVFPKLSVTLDMFGNCFLQNDDYQTVSHGRVNILLFKNTNLDKLSRLYLVTCINKVTKNGQYGFSNMLSSTKVKPLKIKVPVTATGELDTDYMASYVRKIEASYVRKIEAYLSVLGYKSMDDVKLTDHEQKLLDGGVKAQPTSKFRISAFYQVCPISFKYDGSQLRKAGSTPVYSSIETKYGVLGYTDDNPQFDITVNDYLIFGDHTRTMRFPNKSFSVADNTKVLKANFKMTQKQKLFLITAWRRAIPNLGYARHWSIAKKAKFILPVVTTGLASGDPDWQFMEDYITAIEKLKVLKLKQFLDHKLDLYQKIIN